MEPATLDIASDWKEIFDPESKAHSQFLGKILPGYLQEMRWFGAKSSRIKRYGAEYSLAYEIAENVWVYLLFVEVVFQSSNTETYFLPLTYLKKPETDQGTVAKLLGSSGKPIGYLVDAIYTSAYRKSLFDGIVQNQKVTLSIGQLRFSRGKVLKKKSGLTNMQSEVLRLEQSNSTIVYGGRFYLKIYRKLFRHNNPDLELTRYFSEKSAFQHSPNFAGTVEWVRADYYNVSLGLMQEKVVNQGEAWNDTLDEIEGFFKRVEELGYTLDELPKIDLYKPIAREQVPDYYQKLVGESMLRKVELLATRTAEMHIALFAEKTDRHFSPESFTSDYTVWLLNRVMYMFDARFNLLEQNIHKLKGEALEYATFFLENKDLIKDRLLNFDDQSLNSCRIRIHGDYHLGQVLLTGDDFCILDFEGEPESTIRDRKVKQPPVKDLAGLFRSYHYAVFATVFQRMKSDLPLDFLMEAGGRYYRLIVGVSLEAYVKTAMEGGLNIGYSKEIDFLLRYHLLEKAIYELGYELHARPEWVIIPLKGIIQILKNE